MRVSVSVCTPVQVCMCTLHNTTGKWMRGDAGPCKDHELLCHAAPPLKHAPQPRQIALTGNAISDWARKYSGSKPALQTAPGADKSGQFGVGAPTLLLCRLLVLIDVGRAGFMATGCRLLYFIPHTISWRLLFVGNLSNKYSLNQRPGLEPQISLLWWCWGGCPTACCRHRGPGRCWVLPATPQPLGIQGFWKFGWVLIGSVKEVQARKGNLEKPKNFLSLFQNEAFYSDSLNRAKYTFFKDSMCYSFFILVERNYLNINQDTWNYPLSAAKQMKEESPWPLFSLLLSL